jgi:hypothetical protein
LADVVVRPASRNRRQTNKGLSHTIQSKSGSWTDNHLGQNQGRTKYCTAPKKQHTSVERYET